MILASLCSEQLKCETVVSNILISEDIQVTLDGLKKMGYDIEQKENEVFFSGYRKKPLKEVEINVKNSGTSARFLTALLSTQSFVSQIDGNERMRQRPMKDLIDALNSLGASIDSNKGYLPIRINKPITSNGQVELNTQKSSQFASALLLSSLAMPDKRATIKCSDEIASKPYLDMTVQMIKEAGIEVKESVGNVYQVFPGDFKQVDWKVETDYSAASYWFAASAIGGGEIHIPNLSKKSLQGDSVVTEIIKLFGADITFDENSGAKVKSDKSLRGIELAMDKCPDIVPTMSVVAMFAKTQTRLKKVGHLRYKESDRLEAIQKNIQRLGGKCWIENDNLVINPSKSLLHGANILTYDDHRIAMSFSLVGQVVEGVCIENPECVAKSYPSFWKSFESNQILI